MRRRTIAGVLYAVSPAMISTGRWSSFSSGRGITESVTSLLEKSVHDLLFLAHKFLALLQAMGLAFDVDHGTMVQNTVQKGRTPWQTGFQRLIKNHHSTKSGRQYLSQKAKVSGFRCGSRPQGGPNREPSEAGRVRKGETAEGFCQYQLTKKLKEIRQLSGGGESGKISLAFHDRREAAVGGADAAAVPVTHEVPPDHGLQFLNGQALRIKTVVEPRNADR